MPTSAPGSRTAASARRRSRGFTLIELLVVVAIVALTAGLVSLALRDGSADRLEREGQRLSALLEAARAESRASGLAVWWRPAGEADEPGFRFVGLPGEAGKARAWLQPEVRAEVVGASQVVLGPEALIGAQRIVLALGSQRLSLVTDGLSPFAAVATTTGDTP